ncbi:MAG TPA: hypothetical protein VFA12_15095, partial [Stellaceae bacterium]|nr:hypothetical protein [Stellaceae bacterium]
SSMTIGPNSDITIDKFVYNPQTGRGQMAVTAARGVLRYVGGKLSKQDNGVTVTTATATIGVRGGAFLLNDRPGRPTDVIFIYGQAIQVTGQSGCSQVLRRPSYQVSVAGPGACPSAPTLAPPAEIATLLAQLDGMPGRNGGARNVPTNAAVAASGIPDTVSNAIGASIQSATLSLGLSQPPKVDVASLQTNLNVNTVQAQGQSQIAQSLTGAKQTPPPPPPPTIGNLSGALDVNGQFTTFSGGVVQNGVFTATIGGTQTSFPVAQGQSSFSNSGTASPIGPVSGTSFVTSDNTFFYANLQNSAGQKALLYGGTPVNQSFYQTASTSASFKAFSLQPDVTLQSPVPFVTVSSGGSVPNATVSPLFFATPPGSNFSTGTGSTKALQVSLGINGQQANQSSVIVVAVGNVFDAALNGQATPQPILNGIVHGSYLPNAASQPIRTFTPFVTPADGAGASFYGANSISGFVLSNGDCCAPGQIATSAMTTNTSSQTVTNYNFAQPAVSTALPSVGSGTQTTQTLAGSFGGIMTKEPGSGNTSPVGYPVIGTSSISTSAADLHISATFSGGDPLSSGTSGINANNGIVLNFGSQDGTNARQAFINDNLFGALESPSTPSAVNGTSVPTTDSNSGANIYMVTASAAPPTTVLPNGLCSSCQFLQWGYWGGELDTPASGSNPSRIDVGHLNFWVAGIQTPVSQLPTTGSGTYSGSAIGSVLNQGASYIASGGFNATYNFGNGLATASIVNFDGNINLQLAGQTQLGKNTFSVSGSGGNFSGALQGGFFGTGANAASEIGGSFAFKTLSGPSYLASGVFGAKLTGPIH